MLTYALRKVLLIIPTIFLVLIFLFFMLRILPGDPVTAALGNEASAEVITAIKKELGLDRPLHVQFVDYLKSLSRGDLGRSLITRTSIAGEIAAAFPYTMSYTVTSMIFAIFVGIIVGVITAIKRNTVIDYLGRIFSLLGLSFPVFFMGLLLMYFFAIKLDLLPAIGSGSFKHLILPALSGGLIMTAYITRLTRSSMLEVIRADYIATARAKGLRESVVIFRHALKNALISITTIVGMYFGMHFAGSIMIEMIFARPGMGKLLIIAIKQNDYTMVQSLIVVYCFIIITVNLITDLIYGLIDPRIVYK